MHTVHKKLEQSKYSIVYSRLGGSSKEVVDDYTARKVLLAKHSALDSHVLGGFHIKGEDQRHYPKLHVVKILPVQALAAQRLSVHLRALSVRIYRNHVPRCPTRQYIADSVGIPWLKYKLNSLLDVRCLLLLVSTVGDWRSRDVTQHLIHLLSNQGDPKAANKLMAML